MQKTRSLDIKNCTELQQRNFGHYNILVHHSQNHNVITVSVPDNAGMNILIIMLLVSEAIG